MFLRAPGPVGRTDRAPHGTGISSPRRYSLRGFETGEGLTVGSTHAFDRLSALICVSGSEAADVADRLNRAMSDRDAEASPNAQMRGSQGEGGAARMSGLFSPSHRCVPCPRP